MENNCTLPRPEGRYIITKVKFHRIDKSPKKTLTKAGNIYGNLSVRDRNGKPAVYPINYNALHADL